MKGLVLLPGTPYCPRRRPRQRETVMAWTVLAGILGDVSLSPDTSDLPGGSVLQSLTNGVGGWALVLALAGLVIGAAAWALGAHSQNYHQSFVGRRAVLVSGLAALLIGAAPTLINF